jgi:hypothetical protein
MTVGGKYEGAYRYGYVKFIMCCTAGTPADGRTPRRAADGRTPRRASDRRTPRRALRYKGEYLLTLWEREDTEGAPSGRQGRCIKMLLYRTAPCPKWSPRRGAQRPERPAMVLCHAILKHFYIFMPPPISLLPTHRALVYNMRTCMYRRTCATSRAFLTFTGCIFRCKYLPVWLGCA